MNDNGKSIKRIKDKQNNNNKPKLENHKITTYCFKSTFSFFFYSYKENVLIKTEKLLMCFL